MPPAGTEITSQRRWYVLTASAIGAFSATVMGTSVNVALPSLVEALNAPFAVVQWVVLAYLLVTAALLPIVGRLADMVGKRSIFLVGFGVFALGSLLTGLAPGIWTLIAFRSVHGIGSAVLTGLGMAIITDVFPSHERGRAIGINGAILSAGIVLGPTLGGFLVGIGWRWVFLMGVPVGLMGLAIAWAFVPRYERGSSSRFDLPGAAVLAGLLVALSLALTLGQGLGFTAPLVLGLFATAAVLLPAFLTIERRSAAPLVDLTLFRESQLTVGLAAGLGAFVSIAGTILIMPFYLEGVRGFEPLTVGLLMSTTPVLLMIAAPLAGIAADRYGERIVTVVGLLVALVGFASVTTLSTETTALGFIVRFIPVGLGLGIFQTPNNSAIMGAAPRGRSGVAAGLLGLTRSLGQTAGIALLGSVWAVRVATRAAGEIGADAQAASPVAQVGGLHDMMIVVLVLITTSLLLCVWDLRRRRHVAANPVAP